MKPFYLIALILIALVAQGAITYAGEQNPCLVCHAEFKKPAVSVHAVLSSGCQTCHMPAEDKKHPAQKDSMVLVRNMPELCYSCHDSSHFKGKSVHPPVITNTCTACHNPHQSDFKFLLANNLPDLCFQCHKESNFKDKDIHQPVGKGQCMSCHAPHASNFGNMLISDMPELCYRCHDKNPFTKKYVHVASAVPNGCSLCHNPHAASNQYLLLQPVLELCTKCHTEQKKGMHILGSSNMGFGEATHPVKGVPDPSAPSRELTCTSCHTPHSSDFDKLFVQKNLCMKCHKEY